MAKTSKAQQAIETRAANATKGKGKKAGADPAEVIEPEVVAPASEPASEAPKVKKGRKPAPKPEAPEPASQETREVSSEPAGEPVTLGYLMARVGPDSEGMEPASEPEGELSPISEEERADLARNEEIVTRHAEAFIETGRALYDIRNRRLYREEHKSFSAYLASKPKWNFTTRNAQYLMKAATVVAQLEASGETDLPKSESQARPLASLPADQRPEAWKAAKSAAAEKGREPTRADVTEVVEAKRGRGRPPGTPNKPKPPASQDERMQKAVDSGVVAEGTTIETTYVDEGSEPASDDGLSDQAYLEQFNSIRGELIVNTCRIFDASALAFRALAKARSAFSHAFSPIVDECNKKAKTIGPYLARWSYAVRTGDPSTWKVCESCKGNGVSPQAHGGGNCPDCRGNGFIIP